MPGALIDTDRYPVLDLKAANAVVGAARRDLAGRGVAILPGFLRSHAVAQLIAEADAIAPKAHHSETKGTPYLEAPDRAAWPAGHPRVTFTRTSLSAVAYDLFPDDSALRALYEWDPFKRFVGALLGRWPLYRYADPLGALNLAVMEAGDELGWHFDQTDFVVSIALQSSASGGEFESATAIRTGEDERYDDVARALAGEPMDSVHTVPMTPGTLMLFNGRNSMHRVTPIAGPVPRYVALLAYDTEPGTDSSEGLKRVRYGRVA